MKTLTKKQMTTLLIALFFPLVSLATEGDTSVSADLPQEESTLTIIPMIGGNSMNVTGVKANDSIPTNGNAKSGSMIGVLAGYKLGFLDSTIESGLMYMESGTLFGSSLAGIEYNLSYLSVPINWRVPVFTFGKTKFHVKTGVIPSYLIDSEVKGIGFFSGYEFESEKDSFNKFDVIAQAGIGGSYPVYDNFHVHADLSYLKGFQEVTKDGGGTNQGLSLALALAISI